MKATILSVSQSLPRFLQSLKVTSAKKWKLLKMCHLRHRLRILLFYNKIMFRLPDIQAFVFLTAPSFTKSVKSWWVLFHKRGCIFEYIFWTATPYQHFYKKHLKLGKNPIFCDIITKNQCIIFLWNFHQTIILMLERECTSFSKYRCVLEF